MVAGRCNLICVIHSVYGKSFVHNIDGNLLMSHSAYTINMTLTMNSRIMLPLEIVASVLLDAESPLPFTFPSDPS